MSYPIISLIYEGMVKILLILKVLFMDSGAVDLFCEASSGLGPSLLFSNNLQLGFQHHFTRITHEADGSVALAEL